jgi:hypothetical protein
MTKANVMTAALFMAKREVIEDLRDRGLRPANFNRAEIERLALAYIKSHPGLVEQAELTLKKWIARSPR